MEISTKTIDELSLTELEALVEEKRNEAAKNENEERNAYLKLREETILELFFSASLIHQRLLNFKKDATASLSTIYELLKVHSKRRDNDKGNFQIVSEDQTKKIEFRFQEFGSFDERATEAVKHIYDFIREKFQGDQDAKLLIENLLKVKKGQLDVRRVQELYAMENNFNHESWKLGLKLLKESYQVKDSKTYINFYHKNGQNEWELLPLNFSNI
jgi:hypothetical protein